jgi:hypothetical protein
VPQAVDREVSPGVTAADMRAALDLIEAFPQHVPEDGVTAGLVFLLAQTIAAMGPDTGDRWMGHLRLQAIRWAD